MSDAPVEDVNTRCGTVALLGRPNVGKSSLLNAILGQKIAATTHKPQTTRKQLRGIESNADTQVVFVDTPGLHKPKKGLHAFMVSQAIEAARDVNVRAIVVECFLGRGENGNQIAQIDRRDEAALEQLEKAGVSTQGLVLVLNKIDKINDMELLLPVIAAWTEKAQFEAIIPVSAERKKGLSDLMECLRERMPQGSFWYDEDALTTAGEREIAGEIIREKAMLELGDEIPYKLAVVVEDFDESRREDKKKPLVDIAAILHVERESQKGMVVGKGGQRIKAIGSRARKDLERILDCQVMLNLMVRVEPMWTENENRMNKLGYKEQ
ncbi:MAG: GTPase Era [Deltaproteobacteria bacterium]|nr:GTPase Era [Deltaproteobacteria bacterium]